MISKHFGINNYPQSPLRGCINDANEWSRLYSIHGYDSEAIVDGDCTWERFVETITSAVHEANEGTSMVITYSGHGSSRMDSSGDETDHKDECLCLYDEWLMDDDIKNILSGLHDGAKFFFFSDSCHSGTVTRDFSTKRTIAYDDSRVRRLSSDSRHVNGRGNDVNYTFISGCGEGEYSYDATINGRNIGAATHYMTMVLRDARGISYDLAYHRMRRFLPSANYPQTPQIYGLKENIVFA